jgi:hypothetical protein
VINARLRRSEVAIPIDFNRERQARGAPAGAFAEARELDDLFVRAARMNRCRGAGV